MWRLVLRELRPLLEHPRPLPNGQPYARPILDCRCKDLPRLVQITAGIEHPIDLGAVLGPFFDLVVVAVVRQQRVVGFFVRGTLCHIQLQRRPARHPGICPCATIATLAEPVDEAPTKQ
jgi:hypothetical protein